MATEYRKEEMREIIRLREGKSKPGSSFCKFFWQTEHFVFQRPHFYSSVRMYSRRNRNMEEPYNSEGLKNHHKGDGAVGFDYISPHDFIKARKAWFFSMRNMFVWVLHNGIGYLFPDPVDVHVSNRSQSGSWFDISKQWSTSKGPVEKDVFCLWIDHGVRPQGRPGGLNHESMVAREVTYQYVVVPSASLDEMGEERGVEVLANNRYVQAVQHKELGLVQSIFYRADTLRVSDQINITLDSPRAVILKVNDGVVEKLTVSDPSRLLSHLHMKITDVTANQPKELSIDLPDGSYAGQSVGIKL